MTIRFAIPLLTTTMLSATWCTAVVASEIYRWVGEDGVVHYSDAKPRDEGFTTLEVADTRPEDYDPAEDPYSILNQARRVNEAWTELERTRQAREERRREQAQTEPVFMPPPYDPYAFDPAYFYSYSTWPGYRGYPGWAGRQQARAVAALELAGPRPYSINSSAHHERVVRSQFLPLVPPPPYVRPR